MELEFNRLPKTKAVGTRFTNEEYEFVKNLAKNNNVSVGECVHVLVLGAMNELNWKNFEFAIIAPQKK